MSLISTSLTLLQSSARTRHSSLGDLLYDHPTLEHEIKVVVRMNTALNQAVKNALLNENLSEGDTANIEASIHDLLNAIQRLALTHTELGPVLDVLVVQLRYTIPAPVQEQPVSMSIGSSFMAQQQPFLSNVSNNDAYAESVMSTLLAKTNFGDNELIESSNGSESDTGQKRIIVKRKQKRAVQSTVGKKIFVKNLDKAVTLDELHGAFAGCGTILNCNIVEFSSANAAYIVFSFVQEAKTAVATMNEAIIGTRAILVSIFVAKEKPSVASAAVVTASVVDRKTATGVNRIHMASLSPSKQRVYLEDILLPLVQGLTAGRLSAAAMIVELMVERMDITMLADLAEDAQSLAAYVREKMVIMKSL